MKEENININSLWIGTQLSSVELLTLKSFINNGHRFQLWTYDNIETPLPEGTILKDAGEIFPRENIFCYKYSNQLGHGKGSYAGYSDIFRYKLLYLYGGWWTDMDVTCLKPLDFEDEYVFRTHHYLPLIGNIIKCPPESELMKKCFEEAVDKVDENNKDWYLPVKILCENVHSLQLNRYIKGFSNHDNWDLISTMLKQDQDIPEEWHIIHWLNEEWRKRKISKNHFIKNSTLYNLAGKHNINFTEPGFFKNLSIRFKLSNLFN